jgi:hypothetical protein
MSVVDQVFFADGTENFRGLLDKADYPDLFCRST